MENRTKMKHKVHPIVFFLWIMIIYCINLLRISIVEKEVEPCGGATFCPFCLEVPVFVPFFVEAQNIALLQSVRLFFVAVLYVLC